MRWLPPIAPNVDNRSRSNISIMIVFITRLSLLLYQLPEAPPPPDDPPPPEKELLEKLELPELQELPDLPDVNLKPPIEALPLVRRSFLAFLYHLDFLKSSFNTGKAIRYVTRQIKAPRVPRMTMGNIAQKGMRNT